MVKFSKWWSNNNFMWCHVKFSVWASCRDQFSYSFLHGQSRSPLHRNSPAGIVALFLDLHLKQPAARLTRLTSFIHCTETALFLALLRAYLPRSHFEKPHSADIFHYSSYMRIIRKTLLTLVFHLERRLVVCSNLFLGIYKVFIRYTHTTK